MEYSDLIKRAFEAAKNAYNPYSHFAVGACVALTDGTFSIGCNIENAAYGSTMCAERNAIYGAYSHGYKREDIKAIAIVANCSPLVSPCGACRQVLAELLMEDTPIVLANTKISKVTTIKELMPMAFIGESLPCSNQDL